MDRDDGGGEGAKGGRGGDGRGGVREDMRGGGLRL